MNEDTSHRHSIRLPEYDYAQEGAYFVTVCARRRECAFGELVGEQVSLNECGRIVEEEWRRTEMVRAGVELDAYVVMPNHFHGIVVLTVGATRWVAPIGHGERATHRVAPTGPVPRSLGALLGQFKSLVTKRVNVLRGTPGTPLWQRNYYEHVVRDEKELEALRQYIEGNPLQWMMDRENPNRTGEADIYRWLYPAQRPCSRPGTTVRAARTSRSGCPQDEG